MNFAGFDRAKARLREILAVIQWFIAARKDFFMQKTVLFLGSRRECAANFNAELGTNLK